MVSTSTTAPALDGTGGRAAEARSASVRERRSQKRHKLALPGRFMRQNKQEYACRLRDISCSGAAVVSSVGVEPGEHIVAYFDLIGGLEGIVVRTFDGGFAFEFTITQHKREKLAGQLATLNERNGSGGIMHRRHKRIAIVDSATLRLAEDISIQVRVVDVSISGASVETEARPAIGSEVVLGRLRARVVRYHAEGLGLEFMDIQNSDALRRCFR